MAPPTPPASPSYSNPPPQAPPRQGQAAALPNEPKAVTAMVLGILGIAVCGVVAPFAWSFGKTSLDNIRASPGRYAGEGMAQAGYILGIIGTCLLILAVIFFVVYFVIVGALFADMASEA